MSIIQWNCRGLSSSLEEIKVLFRDSKAKIMSLQETKIGDKPFNPGLNYLFHRSPPLQVARAQGGTGFIIHKSIKFETIPLNSQLQACAVRIHMGRKITLCSLYLEPSLENSLQDVSGNPRPLLLSDLQELIDQLPAPFILMGDFNAKHNLWGGNLCDRWGNLVEELIDNNDLVIMNDGSPTRYDVYHNSTSAIDLTLCSSAIRLDYLWSVNQDLHGSDHWPILLEYARNLPSACNPKWKIQEADWPSYENATCLEREVGDFTSPVEAYKYLSKKIDENATKFIPKTSGLPRRPVVPWWNKECEVARKITRTCFRRYLRTHYEADRIAYLRACAKRKRTIKKAKRASWNKYVSNINTKTPSKDIWDKIRKLQGKYVPSPLPIIRDDNRLVSDPKETAELLAKHFAKVSSAENYSPAFQQIRTSTSVVPPASLNTEAFNLPFSMEEMQNAISSSSLTAPGEDGIRYEMISHLPQDTKVFLLETLNGLWISHTSPESWHNSIIVPSHKSGKDPELTSSYRPIALTSCVCKLFERMVNNRLVRYLESKNLPSNK